MPTLVRIVVSALVALTLTTTTASPASAREAVRYEPPVDAAVTDPFRAPRTRYGAGNRGIDYATEAGQPVAAAADGVVTFAGRVGHGLHLVISHDDGVRTSYSFLRAVAVRRGQRVRRGDHVATAERSLHFGARIGDAYIDPHDLFGGGGGQRMRVRLVDDDEDTPPEAATSDSRMLVDHLRRLAPPLTSAAIDRWERDQRHCTPADVEPDVAPEPEPEAAHDQRRIAVLVGGLGSATGSASILSVDTPTLGYDAADVHQFNYRDDGQPYGPADTQQDINVSAERLAHMLEHIASQNDGTPIDVFAHSQGGLVVRAALVRDSEAFAGVATVVTLGTPHAGNVLAAAGRRLSTGLRFAGIDTSSTSVGQLAEQSDFLRGLQAAEAAEAAEASEATTRGQVRSLPIVRSIAASTDAVVPAAATRWERADSTVVVDLEGPPTAIDHSRLPGDPAATREIALALRRLPPTCTGYADFRQRHRDGGLVERAQRTVGAAFATGVAWADDRTPAGGGVVARR